MATMRDIVRRAMRKCDILPLGQDPKGAAATDALEALNSMLHSWALEGVDISHSDLEFSEPFPLGAKFEDGTVHLLAARILPDYTLPAQFDPDGFFRSIQAAYCQIDDVIMPDSLAYMPSRASWLY